MPSITAVLADGRRGSAAVWTSSYLQPWVLWLAAMFAISVSGWLIVGRGMTEYLGDADDATRLLQVRDLMTTGSWFDLKTMKMGGPPGMLSHWSRLIDLPLEALISLFGLFMSNSAAEFVTRAVWPMLILAPLVWIVYRSTAHRHGETSGRLALLLFVLCPLGLYQFGLGRIDHHNVMITASVSAALLMWAYPRHQKAWLAAGCLAGLALAVGYEALAPVAALAVAAAIWGFADENMAAPASAFTTALVTVFTATFLIEFPPSLWHNIYCDAISLNMVVLMLAGGAGLLVALGPGRHWPLAMRLAAIGVPGAIGLAAFGLMDPKCLAGPMGQLPAELKPVWLDVVAETRSIVRDLLKGDIEQSLGLIAYFLVAIAAQVRITRTKRAPVELFLLAILVAFCLFACWQYKFMGYASVIAIVPIAATVGRLSGWQDVRPEIIRIGAALALSQGAMFAASAAISTAVQGAQAERKAVEANAETCSKNTPISDLTSLKPGLMAAYIDIGAYIAALTDHRVLSAPYHRIANAIIANNTLFRTHDDAVASKLLKDWDIDYVVLCRGLDYPLAAIPGQEDTLRAALVAGHAPAFLEPVSLANPQSIFSVWRVRKEALNLQP